jgi:hypothetical protein
VWNDGISGSLFSVYAIGSVVLVSGDGKVEEVESIVVLVFHGEL